MDTLEHYQGDEMIELFNNSNMSTGKTEKRKVVHSKGLIHRSVNVFLLFKGKLLLQQRSSNKTICPNCWDLSVAEHLQPNESYEKAALRGIEEELGIICESSKTKKLREAQFFENSFNQGKLVDREFIELYQVEYDGDQNFKLDPLEVSQIKFIELSQLSQFSKENELTPWFRKEISLLEK